MTRKELQLKLEYINNKLNSCLVDSNLLTAVNDIQEINDDIDSLVDKIANEEIFEDDVIKEKGFEPR